VLRRSADAAFVGDDLAVVRKRPRRDQFNAALELRHRLQGRGHRILQAARARRALGGERHHVLLPFARYRKPHASQLGMTLGHFVDLARMHEHALDLGGLVGAFP